MSKVENTVLKAINERRSVNRFKSDEVPENKLDEILEAGRFAPSWTNTQPWKFIVVKDTDIKQQLTNLAETITGVGIKEAPVVIVVAVNPEADPYHYIEDGAAVTQNMSLAAHSLGLGSFWIGVYNLQEKENESEKRIKQLLGVPESYRVISMLPIGVPALITHKKRKPLSEIVYKDGYGKS